LRTASQSLSSSLLSGGTDWVRADREEKRMRLKEILKKLAVDKNYSDEYRRLAATT